MDETNNTPEVVDRNQLVGQIFIQPTKTAQFIGPCFIGENVTVKSGAKIGPYAVINRNCTIHEGAVLEHSIIWPHTEIGSRAVLRNLIIGHACKIENNIEPKEGTVIEDGSSIGWLRYRFD